MVFIILQSLSSKFGNFMTVIETRLDDEEEVFSFDNLFRLLLKHEKTLNKKMLILSPKDNNVALGATKTPFKKRFKHQKKSYPSSSKKYEKNTCRCVHFRGYFQYFTICKNKANMQKI